MHEHFIYKIPDVIPLEAAGPIMCAAITMFDPLVHWGAIDGGKKMTIGVAGIGGLGTMALKLASAAGHNVVAISSTATKVDLAKEKGATTFIVSKDPEQMAANKGTIDLILNTITAPHAVMDYMPLLRVNGTLVQFGLVT